jgi:hypothetical protein
MGNYGDACSFSSRQQRLEHGSGRDAHKLGNRKYASVTVVRRPSPGAYTACAHSNRPRLCAHWRVGVEALRCEREEQVNI